MLICVWGLSGLFIRLNLRLVSLLTTGIVIITWVAIYRTTGRNLWSFTVIYLSVFILFHFGLIIVFLMPYDYQNQMMSFVQQWFDGPYLIQAIIASILGLIACAIGMIIGKRVSPQGGSNDHAYIKRLRFSKAGFCLMLIGAGGWFVLSIHYGAAGILIGAYGDYLTQVEGGVMAYCFALLGIGAVLLGAGESSDWQKLGFGVFIIFSIVAIPIGIRGQVLFPATSMMAVMAKRRNFITQKQTLVLAGAVLCLIALVGQLRVGGIKNFSRGTMTAKPLDAVAEMGGSIYPVVLVVRAHEEGNPYLYGTSYWAPAERLILKMIPDAKRLPADQDQRLSNVWVFKNYGPYGFSPIAEGYRNGGFIGVIIALLLIGFMIGLIEAWPNHSNLQLLSGIIFMPLFIQIRNAFTPVLTQLIVGLLVGLFVIKMGPIKVDKY